MFKYFPQDEEAEWVKQTGHRGWSYQMIRLISESHYGGGQFSEAHEAARRMRYGDYESWLAGVDPDGRTPRGNGRRG